MPGCKELEQQHGGGGCKCEHYRRLFSGCTCESESVSDHSPGLVGDDQRIIRTLYSPVYINPDTGEVTPAAFSDAAGRGLSVNRAALITPEALEARIKAKIAADKAAGKRADG